MNKFSFWKWTAQASIAIFATCTLACFATADDMPAEPQEDAGPQPETTAPTTTTPDARDQYFRNRIKERLNSMTPEERAKWEANRTMRESFLRQQQIAGVSGEDRQRYLMTSAGLTDTTVQNTIIAFAIEQAQKRKPVTDEGRRYSMLLADADTTGSSFNAQFTKLQTAAREFRAWKEDALKELDAKVKYSSNPRLYALLVLVGILGDEGSDAGGFNAMFPRGLAGDGDIATLLPPVENNFGGPREGTFRAKGDNAASGDGEGKGQDTAPAANLPAPAN